MSRWIFILFLLPFFTRCEKVIDVDLNDARPAVVIEGNLCHTDGTIEVRVSNTGSFFDKEPLHKISNASVWLEYDGDYSVGIQEVEPGIYRDSEIFVLPEKEYQLKVEVDGEIYMARSFLNPLVPLDSLSFSYYSGFAFFEGGYRVSLYFSDPPGRDNYYRIKVYKNGELQNDDNDLIVFDDRGIEGMGVQVRLRGQAFVPGDTAMVEFISIDERGYEYFSTLRDVLNINPGSPAPANPVSNFSNGALGYFSAWSYDSKTIIIQK